jgi:hypothetical protein
MKSRLVTKPGSNRLRSSQFASGTETAASALSADSANAAQAPGELGAGRSGEARVWGGGARGGRGGGAYFFWLLFLHADRRAGSQSQEWPVERRTQNAERERERKARRLQVRSKKQNQKQKHHAADPQSLI